MKLVICAVHDSAAQAYNRPIFVPARGLAVRSFSDEVLRDSPDNPMFHHPSDYSLFELGSFDDSIGLLTPVTVPVLLIRGTDCA